MSIRASVLIVGGSLNGLSAALFLSHHGVRPLVVERHPDTTLQYKFRGISPRSMECYRGVGLEDEIRFHQTGDQSQPLARARNLSDPDVRFSGPAWPDMSDIGACAHATCDQDRLEPILRAEAERLGADVRFHTELTGFEQHAGLVRASIRDVVSGDEQVVDADYMIAADGAGGGIREALGIDRQGTGELQHWMNIIFETDMPPLLQGRPFTSCFVTDLNGSVVPRGEDGRWLLALQYFPARGEQPGDFDEDRCRDLIHLAAGRTDVRADLVDARSWEVAAYVADRFREGRVFLVGDCAHLMPPTGGFGGNTGIHDGWNLAWKLAAVLKEEAAPELLDSYDAERRPVAEATVAQALARLAQWFQDPAKRLPPPVEIVGERSVVFGYVYPRGAFAAGSAPPSAAFEDPSQPSARPGARAPHILLRRGDATVPIHDLFGRGLVLLTGCDGDAWFEAAAGLARNGVPLHCHRIDGAGGLRDPAQRWLALYDINGDGAVLVRPDGMIAWRSTGTAGDPDANLRAALRAAGYLVRER